MAPKMRANLIVGSNYYYTVDTPGNKAFVEAYKKKSGGIPPGYGPGAGYGLMKMVLLGMQKAKSTEPADVIKALEGLKGKNFVGRFRDRSAKSPDGASVSSCCAPSPSPR